MKVDAGLESIPTTAGVFFTLLLWAILLGYTYQKTNILISRSNVDTLSSINVAFYDDEYVFDHAKGLFIAVAFTAWDTEPENILHPSIGEIVFIAEEWGEDESGNIYFNTTRLPTHTCTVEELGLVHSEYNIAERS